MAARRPLVPVLVGATAVGKTAVAMELRHHWPITVISADSRQVYRRLDIGTAKPTPEERRLVRHIGIDLIDPGERYSAGRYASDAASWLSDMPETEQPAIVGGTGFYVRALADGLFREPPLDSQRRQRIRDWSRQRKGLGRWAARLDPAFTGGGQQRAARVIEVAFLTGRPLSWWQRTAKSQGVMRPWYVLLAAPRPVLYRRIEQRTHSMLERGLVEEVEAVLGSGVEPDAPGLDAVGYREVVQHLAGDLSRKDLAQKIASSTRRYAKRQDTWFRHQLRAADTITLNSTLAPADLARQIVDQWNQRKSS
ncbi:MAG: tRNA (adenosine(37)-N6)-dimethylallyltransferase MiaA [Gemmatimonadota bacterium]|nr:MAG: tRNA (adenosine(37)-N6)-dimethylallyltransferase MiaA [Gemmatimonadota bacterium]